MRWGRNTWVIVARTREQRFVRFGVLLLAVGFLCQLVGHVIDLETAAETALAVIAVLVVVVPVVVLAARLANRGLPRYRDASTSDLRIEDVFDIYQIEHLDDVPVFWHAAVGRKLTRSDRTLDAYISHGGWVAECPCGGGIVTSPEMEEAACLDCGTIYAIRFSDERGEIERVLLARPKKENRNWRPGETIAQLRADNIQHELPLFVGGAVSDQSNLLRLPPHRPLADAAPAPHREKGIPWLRSQGS